MFLCEEEDQGDGAWSGEQWDGDGDYDRVGDIFFIEYFFGGEDHADGDHEEDDAAGDTEGGGLESEGIHDGVAGKDCGFEDTECDETFSEHDAAARGGGAVLQQSIDEHEVAEGVENNEQEQDHLEHGSSAGGIRIGLRVHPGE